MSAALKQAEQALKGAISELESVLSAVNEGLIPHDGDEFHERLVAARKALAALEAEQALVALTEEQRRLGMYDEAEPQQARAPGWQDIATAPKDGSRILLWWDGLVREGWCGGAGTSRDGGDWWRSHSLTVCNGRPTHWVPLPPAPQQGAKP